MKKDWNRDYATGAFIRFARLGCPTKEEYAERIRQDVYKRLEMKEPRIILMRAEREVENAKGTLDDISAINKMFSMLSEGEKEYIIEAVRAVYLVPPYIRPKKKEIVMRVTAFAAEKYVSEATVYRWLKYARDLFSVTRGLSID